ncbi:DUF3048 domain-containing protein [Patescibacteria group bacterium]|nr:DUF3048 domain-containing protein [Patescibacteria group bacterium]MBU1705689.1 DUF3048 domain-containing protein [Patescibacteria group bacterium]
MKNKIKKIINGMKERMILTSVLFGALVLALLLGGYAFRGVLFPKSEVPDQPSSEQNEPTEQWRHPLTGLPTMEREDLPQVYAVMIDHSADAWPQAGINQAFLVIEAPVEAGIPRLEAFFYQGQEVDKIGPVRSARPYFVDWANELDAMYVHVGGSNQALELIDNNGTFDLNQFWNGQSFWRDNDTRYAPHNVYTSTELLGKALEKTQAEERNQELVYGVWEFADESEDISNWETADPIIQFTSGSTYTAKWVFDAEAQKYQRWQGNYAFQTETDEDIWANNIAVMITDVEVIDGVGRKEIRTTGRGDAYVFRDGKVIEGKWVKPSASQRLRFITLDGQEIKLNPGTTWIEVIDGYDKLEFSK